MLVMPAGPTPLRSWAKGSGGAGSGVGNGFGRSSCLTVVLHQAMYWALASMC